MGTWAAPNKADIAARLAELVERPILAANASEQLYSIVGDDTLFDMIISARQEKRDADIRPLLAITLDEMLNWMPRDWFSGGWDSGAADNVAKALSLCVAAGDPDGILPAIARYDDDVHARDAVRAVLGIPAEEASSVEVMDWTVPGIKAVRAPDGTLYRFEAVYGVVNEAPAELVASIEAALSPVSAPR